MNLGKRQSESVLSTGLASDRKLRIALLILLVACFAFLYSEAVWLTVKDWFGYWDFYGLVIFLIAIYLIWSQRESLRRIPLRPSLFWGSVVISVGCLTVIAGKISTTLLLERCSLIITLLGLIWLVLGLRHLQVLWLPICYLFLMFPVFDDFDLFGNYTSYFQTVTAQIASGFLQLLGMPVHHEGQLLFLPHITLEIARQCRGTNHIMALVGLAVPLAHLFQRTIHKKVFLIASALIVGLLSNGFRIAMIGVWTAHHPGPFLHGPFNIFSLPIIFIFGFIPLALISKALSLERGPGLRHKNSSSPTEAGARKVLSSLSTSSLGLAVSIFALACVVMFVCQPRSVYPARSLNQLPTHLNGWMSQDVLRLDEAFEVQHADIELKRIYRGSDGEVMKLYIGYYLRQEQQKEVVGFFSDRLQWYASETRIPYDSNHDVTVGMTLDKIDQRDFRAFFWYEINGRIICNRHMAKLASIVDGLVSGKTSAAIVIVVSDTQRDNKSRLPQKIEEEFLRQLIPGVHDLLT